MRLHYCLLLLLLTLASCTTDPNKLITGKWEYASVPTDNPDDLEAMLMDALNAGEYYGSTFEFFSNGKYRMVKDQISFDGTYYFENRNKTLIMTESYYGTETSAEVVDISHEELVLRFTDGEVTFKRAE